MELLEVGIAVVLPAMRSVFDDGEVSSFQLSLADELSGSVALCLTAKGETFHDLVVQGHVHGMTDEDWRERLRSNLVDFVAESRFGWGENRNVR